jgi:hypothetical protein
MRTSPPRRGNAGYISFLLVLATGTILSLLMIYAYRRAVVSHTIESQMQMRVDYSEKEEAILRSIVAITPNRAIRAMQTGSSTITSAATNPLSWQNIFNDALVSANARTSIPSGLVTALNVPNLRIANTGDSSLDTPSRIFSAIPPDSNGVQLVTAGINASPGTGYPPPLSCSDTTVSANDKLYPLITQSKIYGTLAASGVGLSVDTYPNFNLLKYPQINFGYAKPGDNFVAKRNWWAFSVDVGDHDDDKTYIPRAKRSFVLSIYEIPSQLSISSSAFMSLGQFASGDPWSSNVNIDGGAFVGKAEVKGATALTALSSRRGMTLSDTTTVGGQSFSGSPFTPGVRETYQMIQGDGSFFPVSLASESGRAAFIPFNRGSEFFDRFSQAAESNVLSPTTWNNYTIGAMQCAMQLDVTKVKSSTDPTPTRLRFGYVNSSGTRSSFEMPLATTEILTTLPPGYVKVCNENQSYTFSSTVPVDVAYGASGGYAFLPMKTGSVTFSNGVFGDPNVGIGKFGYWRPASPVSVGTGTLTANSQTCIPVYPQRIPAFLTAIGAAGPAVNNSLVVNVDYSTTGLNNSAKKPNIPCTATDYGVVLRECADLTPFTKGFSLVTNLRLFIGEDFNNVTTTPPSGYTPTVTTSNPNGSYWPPCSLFSPERRFGVDTDPFSVSMRGQIGSLASDTATTAVRPLDTKAMSGTTLASSKITVNLSQIRHPAEIPPIAMMNWLVLLEERKREYY